MKATDETREQNTGFLTVVPILVHQLFESATEGCETFMRKLQLCDLVFTAQLVLQVLR